MPEPLNRIVAFFKDHVLPLGKETFSQFQEDNVMVLSSSIAYYALFSLFPLLLVILSLVGYLIGDEDSVARQALSTVAGEQAAEATAGEFDANEELFAFLEESLSPEVAAQIDETLRQLGESRAGAGIIGFLLLALTASRVFGELDKAFQIIWNLKDQEKPDSGIVGTIRTAALKKLLAFGLVLSCAVLLMIFLLAGVIIDLLRTFVPDLPGSELLWQIIYIAISLGLLTLAFMLLFKFLPDTQIGWGDVWPGALLTSLLFILLLEFSSSYIGRGNYEAYGVVGSIMALLVWIFLSSTVLFLGAEFTQVYAHRYGSFRTPPQPPMSADEAHPELTARLFTPPGQQPASSADSEQASAMSSAPEPAQGDKQKNTAHMIISAGVGALAGIFITLVLAVSWLVASLNHVVRQMLGRT
jgi:membrane protein